MSYEIHKHLMGLLLDGDGEAEDELLSTTRIQNNILDPSVLCNRR